MIIHLTYFAEGVVDKYRFTDARPPTIPVSENAILSLSCVEHSGQPLDLDVRFWVSTRAPVKVAFLHKEFADEMFLQVAQAARENRTYMDLDVRDMQFK